MAFPLPHGGHEEDEEEEEDFWYAGSSSSREEEEEEENALYAILNVDRTATLSEIQQAYKRLSRTIHPDKQAQQQQQLLLTADSKEHAEDAFILVKQAHDVLMDPVYRFAYNHGGLLAVELIKRSQQVHANRKAMKRRKRQEEATHTKRGNYHDAGAHVDEDFEDESDDEEDFDDFNDEYYLDHHPNLYKRLLYAKSKEDAIQIIDDLLKEYHLHIYTSKQAPLEASVDLHPTYLYDDGPFNTPATGIWQSEATSSLSIQTQRSVTKQMDCSYSWNGAVDRSGMADCTTRVGIGYRPRSTMTVDDADPHAAAAAATAAASTFYAMDISLNQGASYMRSLQEQRQERLHHQKQKQKGGNGSQEQQQKQQQQQMRPPMHLAFQTSRRLHDKTLVQVAVGGSSLTSLQSWSYSLSSSRIVMLGSWWKPGNNEHDDKQEQEEEEDNNVHLHASWQLAFSMARPTSIHALAGTIRNLTFPQYKLRISPLSFLLSSGSSSSPSSPALKVTVESAAVQAWHCVLSWHALWSWPRFKVTKEMPLRDLFSWKSSKAKRLERSARNDTTDEEHEQQEHSDDWFIKYGFRLDVREWVAGALRNRYHWTLLLQLRSGAWNIRVPIDILQYSSAAAEAVVPPIVQMWLGFVLSQWLEDFLDVWMHRRYRRRRRNKKAITTNFSTAPQAVQEKAEAALLSSSTNSTTRTRLRHRRLRAVVAKSTPPPPPFVEAIRQVAARKRQIELAKPNNSGLVILQATLWKSPSSLSSGSNSGSGTSLVLDHHFLEDDSHYAQKDDVRDLLQFWIVDSQLPRLYIWNIGNNSIAMTQHHHHHHRGEQWWHDWLCCNTNNTANDTGEQLSRPSMKDTIMKYYRQYGLSYSSTCLEGDHADANAMMSRLYVRYQYDGNVYEIEFSSPRPKAGDGGMMNTDTETEVDAIWLPHPRATLMGSVSSVQ